MTTHCVVTNCHINILCFHKARIYNEYANSNSYSKEHQGENKVDRSFANNLKEFRTNYNLSQQQLADRLFVDRSSIAKWESGQRIPDVNVISQIAKVFGVEIDALLGEPDDASEDLHVILVDNERIILNGVLPVLKEALPGATIEGFTKPSDAMMYAKDNVVSIAFLDIEMGRFSGLDVCKELLQINPCMNVIFLTAYADYSFDAWGTGACGFLLKPLALEDVEEQLKRLRFPLKKWGGVQNS